MENNLIGKEIQEARNILGYWWCLIDQNITPSISKYIFERKGKGILTLYTNNNIVYKII